MTIEASERMQSFRRHEWNSSRAMQTSGAALRRVAGFHLSRLRLAASGQSVPDSDRQMLADNGHWALSVLGLSDGLTRNFGTDIVLGASAGYLVGSTSV